MKAKAQTYLRRVFKVKAFRGDLAVLEKPVGVLHGRKFIAYPATCPTCGAHEGREEDFGGSDDCYLSDLTIKCGDCGRSWTLKGTIPQERR